MITVQDAVREFGGRWQSPKSILVIHDDDSYEFCDTYGGRMICTREEFEAEAERQALETLEGFTAYAPLGFSGDPNDCAFKDEWIPPAGVICKILIKLTGTTICNDALITYQGDGVGCYIDNENGKEYAVSHYDYGFRPLKPDRKRWVESAVSKEIMHDDCGMDEVFGRVYDALISGELPIPEAK